MSYVIINAEALRNMHLLFFVFKAITRSLMSVYTYIYTYTHTHTHTHIRYRNYLCWNII